jgi:hypothetical protein
MKLNKDKHEPFTLFKQQSRQTLLRCITTSYCRVQETNYQLRNLSRQSKGEVAFSAMERHFHYVPGVYKVVYNCTLPFSMNFWTVSLIKNKNTQTNKGFTFTIPRAWKFHRSAIHFCMNSSI